MELLTYAPDEIVSATIFPDPTTAAGIEQARAQGVSNTMSPKRFQFRIIGAIALLIGLALAASCRGFFPGTVYTSLTIEPTTPQVPLNGTEGLQVWGTDSTTGARGQITSGASWTVATGTTGGANINSNTGLATGTALGAITVNVSYQGLSTSASGVVYLANITSICVSESNTSGSCTPSSENIDASTSSLTVSLYAIADYTNSNNQTLTQDITTSATWTVSGPTSTDVTCVNTTSPTVCTVTSGATAGAYTITVTYPQTSFTGTNTINVSN
jgi:hypothetical protein